MRKTIVASSERALVGRQVERRQRDQVPQLCDRRVGLVDSRAATRRTSCRRARRSAGSSVRSAAAARSAFRRSRRLSGAKRTSVGTRWSGAGSGARRRNAGGFPSRRIGTRSRGWIGTRCSTPRRCEEAAVRGAAAEQHVLPVVDPVLLAAHRVRRAAEPRARLEERDARAVVGEVERRRDPGEAAADDRDAGAVHAALRARLCASTRPFSQRRSVGRPCSTSSGCERDPLEQPAIRTGHGEHARGAAPVEERHERRARARGGSAHAAPRTRRAARPDRRCVRPSTLQPKR